MQGISIDIFEIISYNYGKEYRSIYHLKLISYNCDNFQWHDKLIKFTRIYPHIVISAVKNNKKLFVQIFILSDLTKRAHTVKRLA